MRSVCNPARVGPYRPVVTTHSVREINPEPDSAGTGYRLGANSACEAFYKGGKR